MGEGSPSSAISLLSAIVPAQMLPSVITTSTSNLVITWAAPNNRGSAITNYEVRVLNMINNVFESNVGLCDYTNVAVMTCTIPMTTLINNLGY